MCSWWKRRGAVVSGKSNSRTAGLASGLGSSCHTGMVDRPAVGRTPLRVRQPFGGPGRPQCERGRYWPNAEIHWQKMRGASP
ncbi:hypothetical protein QFZ97_005682 [Paraburkholderia youngii]